MSKDNQNSEYIRIGTRYYRKLVKPQINGESQIMAKWNKETIIMDYGKQFLSEIPKLSGFTCIPNHLDFQQEIQGFYNVYSPLKYEPQEGLTTNSLDFMKHIFGSQLDLGLDYLKLLYERPTQILPILCLVSKERATGKSTFIKWLKTIFGLNMTYIKGDNFSSQFNADWVKQLIIAIDEVFFDRKEITERLKYLSTTDKDKIEAKGKDREEIEFFGKFILCSNNEDSFIQIDSDEIRFWVRKIKPFQSEDTEFLEKLKVEIPAFLYYLVNRNYSTQKNSRMWFKPEDLMTPALKRLMWLHNNQLEKRIIELFFEIFDSLDTEIIEVTPNDISNILRLYDKYRAPAAEIRKILKKNWNLKPQSNSMKYTRIIAGNYGDFMEVQSCKGRYYTIEKNFILGKYDELMIE